MPFKAAPRKYTDELRERAPRLSHFHGDHLSASALFNDMKPIRIARSETKSLLMTTPRVKPQ
jgi:hypothetical protein